MQKDSRARILFIALLLCLICSLLVSITAVALKDRQTQNKEREKRRNILKIANLYDPGRPVDEQFSKIQIKTLNLETSQFVNTLDKSTNPTTLGENSYNIPAGKDIAGIRSRPRLVELFFVSENGKLMQVILPVYGKGLWSTMYGFISLGSDFSTIKGFGFYEHGETPGLGGEVDNPSWLAGWKGKMLFNKGEELKIKVIKGRVDNNNPEALHQIDGLSGATLTSRGVENMLTYWMGENGYGNFINRIKKTGGVLQ